MGVPETFPDPQAVYRLDPGLIEDFATVLLPELTRDPQTGEVREYGLQQVEVNLGRVVASRNTMLYAIREGDRTTSTVTVNFTPTLTHEDGGTTWIDDVVTDPEFQGRGRSKAAMQVAEWGAAGTAQEVYLSSSTHRGPARAGYEKSGYVLLNEVGGADQRVIFRNSSVEAHADRESEAEILDDRLTTEDIRDIAGLLGVSPELVERNLNGVIGSLTTRAFAHRDTSGRIASVVVANLTPIPVGYKPWINDLAGVTSLDRRAVLAAAESWIGEHYTHANIVAHPEASSDLGSEWVARSSGLYVKRFGTAAVANNVEQ